MKKINNNFLFPLGAMIILIIALSRQMFAVTSFGKFLDPFVGAVQNENDGVFSGRAHTLDHAGITAPANVFFDLRGVPHIYAQNTEDLYFAQGYVTASLRLWQMDFFSYIAAGRMCEIFGAGRFVEYDRIQRRIGIPEAARKSLELIEKDPETNRILTAYTKGVNAYIKQLDYRSLPFEYKFFDYKPEPWTKLKSLLVMKQMANTLSGYEEDFAMSNMMLALGEEKFNKLFPDFHLPITPSTVSVPAAIDPSLSYIKKPAYLDYSFLSSGSFVAANTYNPKLGSNSWVVSGKKTKSGFPILCSDPHLNLSLPAVWLEMQLSSPGLNVYGVSIPGTPAIIVGFNERIAWGIANGSDDVKDWYKLKVTEDYKKYEWDNKWVDLNYSIEEIKIRGARSLIDTVYHSIHGPLISTRKFPGREPGYMNYALKWVLHKPSNEFGCFIKLNRAGNYDEYREAIRNFSSPLQNFTFACKDNSIATIHEGSLPVKFPGQGKFVLDGTTSTQLYTRYIPEDSLPQLRDPSSNYVLTANQHPTDDRYPYYYNGYFSETRASRIREILEKENAFDIEKMQKMQLDNTNNFAVMILPSLLANLDNTRCSQTEKEYSGMLAGWNGAYDFNDEHAELFELWWRNIRDYTWDELKRYNFSARLPDDYVLADLIRNEPNSEYFDKQGTSVTENAQDIITEAFRIAARDYASKKDKGSVQWNQLNRANLMHLSNIPAFSIMNLPSAGYPEAINAMRSGWGPSWRMIVELGDRPVAYGIYAGGQSGHIGTRNFSNFINDWNQGRYYRLQFFMTKEEAQKETGIIWRFNP